jgi:non-heme chloroperoxidase
LKLPSPLWCRAINGLLAYDDRANLSRIAMPTLLIRGEHDALFPQVDQEYLVAAIPGARLLAYAETGHCPNWERPERLAIDLQAFLNERH